MEISIKDKVPKVVWHPENSSGNIVGSWEKDDEQLEGRNSVLSL